MTLLANTMAYNQSVCENFEFMFEFLDMQINTNFRNICQPEALCHTACTVLKTMKIT